MQRTFVPFIKYIYCNGSFPTKKNLIENQIVVCFRHSYFPRLFSTGKCCRNHPLWDWTLNGPLPTYVKNTILSAKLFNVSWHDKIILNNQYYYKVQTDTHVIFCLQICIIFCAAYSEDVLNHRTHEIRQIYICKRLTN